MSVLGNSSACEPTGIPTNEKTLRVVEQSENAWKVALNIPAHELVDQKALLIHLRKVKREIAARFGVAESNLYFDGIADREAVDDAVDVVVNIRKQMLRRGAPRVHFRDGLRGENVYPNMVALLDILYLDQDDHPVSLDQVLEAVAKSGVSMSLVNREAITQKVAEVRELETPAVNFIFARGKLPETGFNAELKLLFPAVPSGANAGDYISRRKISAGNIICTKTSPTKDLEDGFDVFGKLLPVERGQDTELRTGFGVHLSPSGNEVIAEIDGRGTVTFRYRGTQASYSVREVPESALFKVNPVLTVPGNSVVSVSTSQAVQINGDLQAGSRIVTEGDVYITGDVAENSTIEAVDDIVVSGSVRRAALNSDANVVMMGNVHEAKITARGQIIVKGQVHGSALMADTIVADHVAGSDLTARKNIVLRSVDPDENGVISNICVGISGYYKQRIIENQKYIEAATAGLERLEALFGREIVVQCDRVSLQMLFMRFLTQTRDSNRDQRHKAEVYRELMETIPPIKSLLRTKQEELRDMLQRVIASTDDIGLVSVEERLKTSTRVSVDGIEAVLPEGTGPAVICSGGNGQLSVTSP
ncbi:DUF342 domain-containing protein [candidate division KSB1 bacterium]|nr:MAG: DUF342 domain-containing protein [candidate division KSB1 bacterium]